MELTKMILRPPLSHPKVSCERLLNMSEKEKERKTENLIRISQHISSYGGLLPYTKVLEERLPLQSINQ
jgi:hypothetical protein